MVGRETAGITTRVIVAYVRHTIGDEGVARMCELAGETRDVAELEDERGWSSYAQKVALFEAAARLTGDEWVARRVGEALLAEQIAPPVRLLIGALGSPQQVLRSCAKANAKFSTNSTMRALEADPGRAVVTYRVDDGYEPSLHDCRYTQGILTQATVLFGQPPATIVHHECQVEGAEACRYEVLWPRWRSLTSRLAGRRDRSAPGIEVEALREQVLDLQRTVADLVSVDDVDDVLARIATRASAAVRGQSYVLAVAMPGERTPRIHSDGLGTEEAAVRGRALLAGAAVPGDDLERIVVEVASARQRYGWLAAYLPAGKGFLPAEEHQLEVYARLAAAALDAATALAAARRGREIAGALVTLARELAHHDDPAAIAELVSGASRVVAGAPRSMVLLWDAECEELVASAVHGFGELEVAARTLRVALGTTPVLDQMVVDPQPRMLTPTDGPWMTEVLSGFAVPAAAAAPIVSRGRFAGLILASCEHDVTSQADDEATLLRRLSSLADQAGVALANVSLLEDARRQARHDPLTGLPNRLLLHERIEHALADGQRRGRVTAVCFLDLDQFKRINDDLGHAAGDQLLVEVAGRLRGCVRETDELARVSGDEFVVVLRDLADREGAERVASEIVAALGRPCVLGGAAVETGVSVGIAFAPEHGRTPDELLRSADAAMYVAKRERGTYRYAVEEEPVPVW